MQQRRIVLAAIIILNMLTVSLLGYNAVILEQVTQNQLVLSNELNVLTMYLDAVTREVLTEPGTCGEFNVEIHLKAEQYRDGVLLLHSEHAGVLTTIGKNYIEGLLGNNSTSPSADRISLSNNTGAPNAAWTQIPDEIAANNLTRASGTYTSTGDGVWTIVYTFTASGTQNVTLAGLNWAPSGNNNLLCADQISLAAMITGDTLEITWTITVT